MQIAALYVGGRPPVRSAGRSRSRRATRAETPRSFFERSRRARDRPLVKRLWGHFRERERETCVRTREAYTLESTRLKFRDSHSKGARSWRNSRRPPARCGANTATASTAREPASKRHRLGTHVLSGLYKVRERGCETGDWVLGHSHPTPVYTHSRLPNPRKYPPNIERECCRWSAAAICNSVGFRDWGR